MKTIDTVKLMLRLPLALLLAGGVVLALPQAVQAQRTSLTDIDQKLDAILNELDALRGGPPLERIVFVTSTIHLGNFGGLAGADDICNLRATEAALPGAGNYRAWLSDDTRSPSNRFVRSSVPYVLVDGTLVADDWQDLTDGSISSSIHLTESASAVPDTAVWTGTDADGTRQPDPPCSNWTSSTASDQAFVGIAGGTDTGWTESGFVFGCNAPLQLYCFQQ